MSAAIGLLEVEFLIPGSFSLKDKRRVLRSIRDQCAHKFNVSLAEVEHQNLPGRSHFAVVSIAAERATVEKRLSDVEQLIESHSGVSIIERQVQWL